MQRAMHYPCTVPFDSQTLAHAFFPPHGQIHINDNVRFAMTNFTERTGGKWVRETKKTFE